MSIFLKKINFITIPSICFLIGCSVGPDYKRPKVEIPTGSKEIDLQIENFLSEKWWKIFNDKTLNELEEEALKNNHDIEKSIAIIEEASAINGVAVSDLMPSIGSGFKSEHIETTIPQATSYNKMSAGFNVSYELDFFGKYKNAFKSSRAKLLASHASKQIILLAITSEVARTYFSIRALDAKLIIAKRTLKTREESYNVYKNRFKSGYSTELDYLRIESEMENVRTTVKNLESMAEKAENAMSLLIGCNPKKMISRKTKKNSSIESLKLKVDVPSGLPSTLINRRPDVVQAEATLISSNAEIGKAMAAHFPSFSLTGSFGYEATSFDKLLDFDSHVGNFIGNITFPIFNAGKLTSAKNIAKAKYKQSLADYKKSLQIAFKETLDSLVSVKKNKEILLSRKKQVAALKKSYEIAKIQKDAGLIGLLDLLDIERGLLAAEMELSGALENKLTSVVDLCKALGGGWDVKKLFVTAKSYKTKKKAKIK